MKGKSLEEQWKHWNESPEHYLGMVEDKKGTSYIGRGKEISFVKKARSAPQDNSEGSAITEEIKKNQAMLNIMRKHRFL
eukprot:2771017-Heterocapsa_arctica.AAC.1